LAVRELEESLQEIVGRHESLRTVFAATSGEAQQQVVAPFERKVADVMRQLTRREAVIFYDPGSDSVDIVVRGLGG
jgi:uncharacterized protein YheU (UPF0270 family)